MNAELPRFAEYIRYRAAMAGLAEHLGCSSASPPRN